ncbi:MAG: hypothetical protein I3273_01760 [Candidatus Moeniiplasma glomeromycotorum]|nr:hypothetical protein [Candidatus Moeniiplasma glomeromycotorum]MCE8167153.1 hypothetical protein [Candidatus Moeniiplasma glomeromycotorum]MCE8168835.1 hypothetical protein [Candidatus Moeniiplasma glomeromycotorum]
MVNLNELNRLKNQIYSEISNVVNEMRSEGETDFYNPLKEYYDALNSIEGVKKIELKLNAEIRSLKSQIDDLDKKLLDKSSDAETSEKFNQIISQKEQELEALDKKHTEICVFYIETCNEKSRLEKEVNNKKREIEDIKIQHQLKILNLFQTSITNLAKLEDKSERIAKLFLKNYRVVKSNLSLHRESAECRSGVARLFKYRIEKLNKQDYEFLKETLKEIKILHDELEETKENKNTIIGQQWVKINNLTKNDKDKRKIIDRLTISLGAETKKNQKLESEKEELKEFIVKKEKVIEQLTKKLETITKKSSRSKQYQENLITNLTAKNEQLKSQNNSLQGKVNYYQAQDDQLRTTIQDLQIQISQLQKEKKSLTKQKGTAQQRAQQLRKDLRTNHKSWQEKYNLLEQENIQLTDNKENLEQAGERLFNAYQEKDQEALQLQTNLNTLLTQRDDLYLQLSQFSGQLSNNQTTIQNLQQEKTNLTNQLTNKDSLITNLNNQLVDKDNSIANLTTERSQLEEQRNQFQEQNNNLNQTLQDLAISLGQKRVKSRNLTRWKKMLSEAIQTYQTDLANRHSELQTAQTEIKELTDNYQASKEEAKKQQKAIQRLEKERSQFEEQKQNWQSEKQQLLAEIELLKNPPQQPNKEKLQVETTQYQEQVKALVQKLPTEQIKTINLLLQEQKNKFNQQLQAKETQINLLDKGKQRERERQIYWGVILLLILTVLILLIQKKKKLGGKVGSK